MCKDPIKQIGLGIVSYKLISEDILIYFVDFECPHFLACTGFLSGFFLSQPIVS